MFWRILLLLAVHTAQSLSALNLVYPHNDIFAASRNTAAVVRLCDYPVEQLKMVGYIRYANIDYALIATPLALVIARVGAKVKSGRIILITSTELEIDLLAESHDEITLNRLILTLDDESSANLPVLWP